MSRLKSFRKSADEKAHFLLWFTPRKLILCLRATKMGHLKYRPPLPSLLLLLLFLLLSATCFAADINRSASNRKSPPKTGHPSSVVLSVSGNVYPLGFYSASLVVGDPPKAYDLDIDTGSDLTWVQCNAPCTGCTLPLDSLFEPQKHILVQCEHPSCDAINESQKPGCDSPEDQCDFEVEYADHGSITGVLVREKFPLRFLNGSLLKPSLAFGCAYNLMTPGPYSPPATAGVLGLGSGKVSILSQLHELGMVRRVFGHCFGEKGGFLFLGDDLVPSSGMTWLPVSGINERYQAGPAEIVFGGKPTGIEKLSVFFDSGSSYTYLSSHVYETILELVTQRLNRKELSSVHDQALPNCWKGKKPFKSIHEVANHFKTLSFRFTEEKKIQMELPPSNYLVVTEHGNVCLGILNGTEAGLGDFNIIGDISLKNRMVVYDNELQHVGWMSQNCDRLPSWDVESSAELSEPYAAQFGIAEMRSVRSN